MTKFFDIFNTYGQFVPCLAHPVEKKRDMEILVLSIKIKWFF